MKREETKVILYGNYKYAEPMWRVLTKKYGFASITVQEHDVVIFGFKVYMDKAANIIAVPDKSMKSSVCCDIMIVNNEILGLLEGNAVNYGLTSHGVLTKDGICPIYVSEKIESDWAPVTRGKWVNGVVAEYKNNYHDNFKPPSNLMKDYSWMDNHKKYN